MRSASQLPQAWPLPLLSLSCPSDVSSRVRGQHHARCTAGFPLSPPRSSSPRVLPVGVGVGAQLKDLPEVVPLSLGFGPAHLSLAHTSRCGRPAKRLCTLESSFLVGTEVCLREQLLTCSASAHGRGCLPHEGPQSQVLRPTSIVLSSPSLPTLSLG